MITLVIDGKQVKLEESATVLEAARETGIYIPTLCYHPSLPSDGSCELCLVEVEGREDFPLACVTPATEGMVIHTDTPQVRTLQKDALKQILSHHPCACLTCWRRKWCNPYDICLRNVAVTQRCVVCPKNKNCELQQVVDYVGLEGEDFACVYRDLPVDTENPLFDRDYNFCIGCSRCVRMCEGERGIGAIKMIELNGKKIPAPSDDKSLISSGCRYCSACVEVCPTGALIDKVAKWNFEVDREEAAVPCHYACPAGIDVPLYVHLIQEGKFADSLAIIREKVPFPEVLGRVCIHPCEQACRRNALNEPISIKFLKRFVADCDAGEWRQHSVQLPSTGKKIAVVGSGPGGLTTAYYLAKLGHSVIVFEQFSRAGGMLRVGIPDYRLPSDVLDAEIHVIEEAGVDIKLNTKIESIDDLFGQGYDAVFLAVGAHRGMTMGVDGEDSPGVVDGASFLRSVNLGEKVDPGRDVAVVGGGNVAIDSARTALRLGAKDVTILYRRTRAEMPASSEEVEAALEEKINIVYLAAPVKISQIDGRLEVTCIRMELGEPDASGRRRPVPIKGSEFSTKFDSVIAAIGQTPEIPDKFDLKTGRGNTLQVDAKTLATDRQGVWAGGDVVSGPASVIEAIAAGRKAASSIDKYLGGSGVIDEELTKERQFRMCVGKEDDFIERPCVAMRCLPVEQREGYIEVELGFDEQEALRESRRCFQCGIRLQIPPAPLPPIRKRTVTEEAIVGV